MFERYAECGAQMELDRKSDRMLQPIRGKQVAGMMPNGLGKLPKWRTVATTAGVVITAVLILELGIWYFLALIAIYAALDITQRTEARRGAQVRLAILNSVDNEARRILFFGSKHYCESAGWVARGLGWMVSPIAQVSFLRHSITFKAISGAAPLSQLLEALHEEKLATRIRLPDTTPSFGRRLSEHSGWGMFDLNMDGESAPAFFRNNVETPSPEVPQRRKNVQSEFRFD